MTATKTTTGDFLPPVTLADWQISNLEAWLAARGDDSPVCGLCAGRGSLPITPYNRRSPEAVCVLCKGTGELA